MELVCRDCKTTIIVNTEITSCPQCGSFNIDIYDGSEKPYKSTINGEKDKKKNNIKWWIGHIWVYCVLSLILGMILIVFSGEEGYKAILEVIKRWWPW